VSEVSRIGVFGGTFDPLHTTHLAIAEAALEQAGLDKVLFVISAEPPHKRWEVFAPAEDRYDMVRAATAPHPGFEPCRLEIDRRGPSYTVDTLRLLREANPAARLFLIVGYDSLVDLPKWRDPETILSLAHLLAVPRPASRGGPPRELEGHFTLLNFEISPVSSTWVREILREGRDTGELLPSGVLKLIKERGLYHARA
jgi:nicotinate-nucleotide adenylyltransferase